MIFFKVFIRIPLKNCNIKAFWINFINFRQEFPGPRNRFFFKIVPKAPVSKHFKKSMMISIDSYLLKIIMLTGYPQTFLCISNSRTFRFLMTKKIRLELIHPSIGKHQRRIVLDYHRRRRYNSVSL
ncbi:MAG: Uncharacterised protein [Bacteroidetes bacterium MED-G17]|nr:MAG: Uncharacterised protein [Bacteroidetes bacterium MED-G17]